MKKLTVIFDFNNLMSRVFFVPPVLARTKYPDYDQLRFFAVNSIYFAMFKTKATEIILAVDSRPSWRIDIYPRYKESRKKKRDIIVDVDFPEFYRQSDKLLEDIKEYLPFKVIRASRAEADDVAAVISLNYDKIFVIVSTDKDFYQLCSRNIKIYNPIKKEFIHIDDTEDFLVRASLSGQRGKEDVFNVRTPLDWPPDKRKPALGPEGIERIMRSGYKEWLISEGLVERYELNRQVIDFKYIPDYIKTSIIEEYDKSKLPEISKAYEFFKENKFNTFLEDYHQTENSLLRLYEN